MELCVRFHGLFLCISENSVPLVTFKALSRPGNLGCTHTSQGCHLACQLTSTSCLLVTNGK